MEVLPTNLFFGFHDVSCWDDRGDYIACLGIDNINRPPISTDRVVVGYLNQSSGHFKELAESSAFNYPQGARQLWVRGSNAFWFNCVRRDHFASTLIGIDGVVLRTVDQALYCLSPDGRWGYGLNFARLNRLGGYGYVGLLDSTMDQARPVDCGIYRVDLRSGDSNILVSISDVAAYCSADPASHHYLTHIVPSPSGRRLLFLHRWWLPDGGISSRLMSCASDGTDIKCHAEGFLSHFDWWDEHRLIIYGRLANKADQLRRLGAARHLGWALKVAKSAIRCVRPKAGGGRTGFLLIETLDNTVRAFWPELLSEDGHPMFCPANRDWLSIDTYPNENRMRQLKLLNAVSGRVVDLGNFQYPDLPLDRSLLQMAFANVDPVVLRNVNLDKFAWARSGLHCDLHPRWKPDGTALCFDSIHEGHRDIYVVDTSPVVTESR